MGNQLNKNKPNQTKLEMKYFFSVVLLSAAAMARLNEADKGAFLGFAAQYDKDYPTV